MWVKENIARANKMHDSNERFAATAGKLVSPLLLQLATEIDSQKRQTISRYRDMANCVSAEYLEHLID